MASQSVYKNMPPLNKWVSTAQKHVKVIKNTTGDQQMTRVRCFYLYLENTYPVWRDQSAFVEIIRFKTHEFWHEKEVRQLMEYVIKKYNWTTCGRPTKSGKPCKNHINFGDTYCYIHSKGVSSQETERLTLSVGDMPRMTTPILEPIKEESE